jgi:hypothetical protein
VVSSEPEDPGIRQVDGQGDQVMRIGEPRNPPPGQSADYRDARWRGLQTARCGME